MKSSKLSFHTMNLKIPFMHYNLKSHTPFMSSDIKINLNGKGRIWLFFSYNFIRLATRAHIVSTLGIIIHLGVYGDCVRHFLT